MARVEFRCEENPTHDEHILWLVLGVNIELRSLILLMALDKMCRVNFL